MLDLSDIQGILVRSYGMDFSKLIFVRFADAAAIRCSLVKLVSLCPVMNAVTWSPEQKPTAAWNIAFTFQGLQSLYKDGLEGFSNAFRNGMPAARQTLGDTGKNASEYWDFGGKSADAPIDCLLLVYGSSAASLENLSDYITNQLNLSVGDIHIEPCARLPDPAGQFREHFGFVDGISQPAIEGLPETQLPGNGRKTSAGWQPLDQSLFILNDEQAAGSARISALAKNGAYLVVRKLEQDVYAFRDYMSKTAAKLEKLEITEGLLAAKLVGRWQSGCPLALSPSVDNSSIAADMSRNNNFDYSDDPEGNNCPVSAHIRRANPRNDTKFTDNHSVIDTHRMIRRGMPYGSVAPLQPDTQDKGRGLMFMAICANIEKQFEHVQNAWINDGQFLNLGSAVDPIVGFVDAKEEEQQQPESRHQRNFSIPQKTTLFNLPDFVTVKGGGYFFLPSLTSLKLIINKGSS